jgi:hypothetical protein
MLNGREKKLANGANEKKTGGSRKSEMRGEKILSQKTEMRNGKSKTETRNEKR